jgi:hypothetical protein
MLLGLHPDEVGVAVALDLRSDVEAVFGLVLFIGLEALQGLHFLHVDSELGHGELRFQVVLLSLEAFYDFGADLPLFVKLWLYLKLIRLI